MTVVNLNIFENKKLLFLKNFKRLAELLEIKSYEYEAISNDFNNNYSELNIEKRLFELFISVKYKKINTFYILKDYLDPIKNVIKPIKKIIKFDDLTISSKLINKYLSYISLFIYENHIFKLKLMKIQNYFDEYTINKIDFNKFKEIFDKFNDVTIVNDNQNNLKKRLSKEIFITSVNDNDNNKKFFFIRNKYLNEYFNEEKQTRMVKRQNTISLITVTISSIIGINTIITVVIAKLIN
ncbi:MAG: hypothetical protein ACRDCG_02775 [Mycoplasmoidaceae bacterium]